MVSSILEQYRISDFIDWYDQKNLRVNRRFQRRSVWTPAARVLLIDTILRELPIPKIYMRTQVDLKSKKSYREVVDGQQRLLAIVDFAKDNLVLTKRTGEFSGLTYSTLEPELQEKFLSYAVSVGQLINASDQDVLEVFARLNCYTVSLNAQELRHAEFQGPFKWSVYETSRKLGPFLEEHGVLTTRQRIRMLDDQMIAEMYGVILNGVCNGGQPNIKKIYAEYDKEDFEQQDEVEQTVMNIAHFAFDNFADIFEQYPTFSRGPHFLMLFAAVAHALKGIPRGDLTDEEMPQRIHEGIPDMAIAQNNLQKIAATLEGEDVPSSLARFLDAASSSTQRISSRRVRFPIYYKALTGNLT